MTDDVKRYWVLDDELRDAALASKAAKLCETEPPTEIIQVILASDHDAVVMALREQLTAAQRSNANLLLCGKEYCVPYVALQQRVAELEQAIGMLTTLVPDMQIDSEHPVEMAKHIVCRFNQLIDKLGE